jgi:ribosomal protein S18 acetylase RimI-like enzyme
MSKNQIGLENMKPAIRAAARADAALLSSLNTDVQAVHARAHPCWFKPEGPETFPPAAAEALLTRTENLVLIAEVDSEPVGYAYAEVVQRPEDAFRQAYRMVYVHHLSVRPAWQRRGIGEALLASVRQAAADRGIALLGLDVWSFNEGARAFFRRQGFATYNERMWSATLPRPASEES